MMNPEQKSTLATLGAFTGVRTLCLGVRNERERVRCAILDTGVFVYPPYDHQITWKREKTCSSPLVDTCVLYRDEKQWIYINAAYCRNTGGQCWPVSAPNKHVFVSEEEFGWLLLNRRDYHISKDNDRLVQTEIHALKLK